VRQRLRERERREERVRTRRYSGPLRTALRMREAISRPTAAAVATEETVGATGAEAPGGVVETGRGGSDWSIEGGYGQ
jgi:hypothetical protein